MMLGHRTLGPALLVTSTLLLACTPAPPEVMGTGATSSPSDDTGTTNPSDPTASSDGADSGPSFEVCGNGIVEGTEQCDLGDLNDSGMYCTATCTNNVCGDGYLGPGEACDDGNDNDDDLCTTECGPTTCGDGIVQGGEQCDDGPGNSENGACLPSCVQASCGDLFIQADEEVCDATNIDRQTCQMQGLDGGELACARDCTAFDTSGCYECGDGAIDEGEECDGAALGGETCVSQTFDDGTLACTANCTFDTMGCISFACGNNVIDGADQCDGMQLGGATCVTQGFAGGPLACTGTCTFDTSACTFCGDHIANGSEECDDTDLGGSTCSDVAPVGQTASGSGMPGCDGMCMLTEGSCTFCGDGVREGTELCDGGQFDPSVGCDDFAGGGETPSGGMPGCTAACVPTVGSCTFCGNDNQEGTEECDGNDLDGGSCSSPAALGPGHGGTLDCANDCTYDTSMCCLSNGQACTMDEECCSTSCHPVMMMCN